MGIKLKTFTINVLVLLVMATPAFFLGRQLPLIFEIQPDINTKTVEHKSSVNSVAVKNATPYPVKISIPTINVEANIEKVGLTNNGDMAPPQNEWDVAWYSLGTTPGNSGDAVIAGHLDSKTGAAVFWNLANLKPSDYIYITDSSNKIDTFQVIKTVEYPDNNFPIKDVFNFNTTDSNLNLITCAGSWDKTKGAYNDRIVVFSTLVSTINK